MKTVQFLLQTKMLVVHIVLRSVVIVIITRLSNLCYEFGEICIYK